jgi:hypothetical protein
MKECCKYILKEELEIDPFEENPSYEGYINDRWFKWNYCPECGQQLKKVKWD